MKRFLERSTYWVVFEVVVGSRGRPNEFTNIELHVGGQGPDKPGEVPHGTSAATICGRQPSSLAASV